MKSSILKGIEGGAKFVLIITAIVGVFTITYALLLDNGGLWPDMRIKSAAGGDAILNSPNVKFASPNISYVIINCSEKDRKDTLSAFALLQNHTVIRLSEQIKAPDLEIKCDYNSTQGRVNAEGTQVMAQTSTTPFPTLKFNQIWRSRIEIYSGEYCRFGAGYLELHELLHSFGFSHSNNTLNIMYPLHQCQEYNLTAYYEIINKLYNTSAFNG